MRAALDAKSADRDLRISRKRGLVVLIGARTCRPGRSLRRRSTRGSKSHLRRRVDPRPSIPPDVPMKLASADFFAGKDPVLDAVMDDRLP